MGWRQAKKQVLLTTQIHFDLIGEASGHVARDSAMPLTRVLEDSESQDVSVKSGNPASKTSNPCLLRAVFFTTDTSDTDLLPIRAN